MVPSEIGRASSSRHLRLRKRQDLIAERQMVEGRACWIVKDPLALKYFRFPAEEYDLLMRLDGKTSLDELQAHFERQRRPQRIALDELQEFVTQLYQAGLVVSDAPNQGLSLDERRGQRQRKQQWEQCGNFLAIRFRGVNPQRLLDAVYPWIAWCFSPWCIAASLALAVSALALIVVQADRFAARLPAFESFFTAEQALWLALVLSVTKILHELGHAFSSKHFGRECPEMGLMLLVFTPCLYCNISDSWLIPEKWRRMAIAAAGMYVELVLAAAATWLWWFSQPGLLNSLCLGTMLVCSVSTVLINGNPLMRYDGYYILSDLVEMPNLAAKARRVLLRQAAKICLGWQGPADPSLPPRRHGLLAGYALASAAYRWVVTVSILWFLNGCLAPYGLKFLGQWLAIVVVAGMLLTPLWQLRRYYSVPGRLSQVKAYRAVLSVCVLSALIALTLGMPWPRWVQTTLILEPRDAARVYVQVPGILDALPLEAGGTVEAGQLLGRLTNLELEQTVLELTLLVDEQRLQTDHLLRQRFQDPAAVVQLPTAQEALADLEKRLAQRLQDMARLQLRAPVAGTILPPPTRPAPPKSDPVPRWSGTPLEPRNLGTFLESGTLFCLIADVGPQPAAADSARAEQWQAVLHVDPSEIELVREGQPVELQLEGWPDQTFPSRIAELSRVEQSLPPRAAGPAPPAPTFGPPYQARVFLDSPPQRLLPGLTGRARIHVGSQTLGERLWRYLHQTFHFQV